MAGMSVDGLISGLDTTSLINQLIQAEAAPQTAFKSKVSEAQAAVAAYQGINTRYAALRTAAEAVANADTWSTPTATSSSASVKATSPPPVARPARLRRHLDREVAPRTRERRRLTDHRHRPRSWTGSPVRRGVVYHRHRQPGRPA